MRVVFQKYPGIAEKCYMALWHDAHELATRPEMHSLSRLSWFDFAKWLKSHPFEKDKGCGEDGCAVECDPDQRMRHFPVTMNCWEEADHTLAYFIARGVAGPVRVQDHDTEDGRHIEVHVLPDLYIGPLPDQSAETASLAQPANAHKPASTVPSPMAYAGGTGAPMQATSRSPPPQRWVPRASTLHPLGMYITPANADVKDRVFRDIGKGLEGGVAGASTGAAGGPYGALAGLVVGLGLGLVEAEVGSGDNFQSQDDEAEPEPEAKPEPKPKPPAKKPPVKKQPETTSSSHATNKKRRRA